MWVGVQRANDICVEDNLRALLASNKDDEPEWRLLWTKLCSPHQCSYVKAHNPQWHLENNWV